MVIPRKMGDKYGEILRWTQRRVVRENKEDESNYYQAH